MDHGKVGRWIAVSWNFMPSFMDVFEHHHDPGNAQHDPYLVAIVSAADQFLQTQEVPDVDLPSATDSPELPLLPDDPLALAETAGPPAFLSQCFPSLAVEEHLEILEALQTEYTQVLPLVQLGIAAVAPESGANQISVQEKKK
jgi:hypothetical protein